MIAHRYALAALILLSLGCRDVKYKNKPENPSELNTNILLEQRQPNLAPMYGRTIKTEEQKAADRKYVATMLRSYGDTRSASVEAAKAGWYYFYHEIIDTSMFRFNQSWLIDSTYPGSYFGFAALREYQGLKVDAEYYYRLAYEYGRSDSIVLECLRRIAKIREDQKDTTGLMTAYARILSRYPGDGVASGKLGYFYSCLHQPDSAMKYYTLTIHLLPEYDQTYINRGWLYFQTGKYQKAIDDYSLAIKWNKNATSAYANRAQALMAAGRIPPAMEDIGQCIKQHPEYPNFHTALAECLFLLGERTRACDELDKAIRLGDPDALLTKKERCK